jgi:aspartate carbamoyltransferase catalytic subunit
MTQPAKVRHIIDTQQLEPAFMADLFKRAKWMGERLAERDFETLDSILRLRRMFSLFYEPSTRTRFSFAEAAIMLGMRVQGSENAAEFSSRSKGESDLDSFLVLASYQPDVIVVRHDAADMLATIAERLDVPIINAGDGSGQHPTQALLDLYTIQAELGRLHDLHTVIVGDLKHGRTARSLAYMLGKYPGNRITFVAPEEWQMGEDILSYLRQRKVSYSQTAEMLPALQDADILYYKRIEAERIVAPPSQLQARYDEIASRYQINPAVMAHLPKAAIVMDALPRVAEGAPLRIKTAKGVVRIKGRAQLSPDCDADPRAAYFRQAGNGLLVRMALLEWVVTGAWGGA